MSESLADKLAKQAHQHAANAKEQADERESKQNKLDEADLVKLRTAITELISDYPKIFEEAVAKYWQDPATKHMTSFGVFAQFIGKYEVLRTELEPLLNDLVKNELQPILLRDSRSTVFDNTWKPIGNHLTWLPGRANRTPTNRVKFFIIRLNTTYQDLTGWYGPKVYQCQFGTDAVSVGAQFLNKT